MVVSGILTDPSDAGGRQRKPIWPDQSADKGLTVRHRSTGVVGTIKKFTPQRVTLVDAGGREEVFPVTPGSFSVKGRTVNLVRPQRSPVPTGPAVTASGSIRSDDTRARVARASRILVEGIHDAELVEKIWGDDLRVEGVVVEPLHGVDDLGMIIADFDPSPDRRLGVLLDHLVDRTKESRIAAAVGRGRQDSVLITGHNFVDIWAAVKPGLVGLDSWPDIPRSMEWKEGIRQHLNFHGSTGQLWSAILAQVSTYRDLHPSLVGAVEQLIDFVAPPSDYD